VGRPPDDGALVLADAPTIARAASLIRGGAIVGYPTETLYGLAADALSRSAIEALLQVKGRDPAQSLPLLVVDLEMARGLVEEIPPLAQRLMAAHWPGPLTVVLRARSGLPAPLVSDRGGVGLRVSADPVAADLTLRVGRPITATSANRSGQPPATSAVLACLDGVALVLDDGVRDRPASTVIELLDTPRILRRGAITIEGW
jgi:L-threonylcarbamoyladenylate synthase